MEETKEDLIAKIKILHLKLRMIEEISREVKDLDEFIETCTLNELF